MNVGHDLFFSYRRRDLAKARPLLSALVAAGLRVWRDEDEIDDHAPITRGIREAIAGAKVLLAFYSRDYPLSHACNEELLTAWLAALNLNEPHQRVLLVNVESDFSHIPEFLRDQQIPHYPVEDLKQFATALRDRVGCLTGPLNAPRPLPEYYGFRAIQAERFVGRIAELWELHSQLVGNRISIITGMQGQAAAQLRGMGGNGKSLLAREYAIRFGPAFPGGVFWLNAYGNDDTRGTLDTGAREALRSDQIRGFCHKLGIAAEGRKPAEVEAAFWQCVAQRTQSVLWIVDDLPSGLSLSEIEQRWVAGWTGASTLITTRCREYGGCGSVLDLDVLSPEEAVELLGRHRHAGNAAEAAAMRRIAEELGNHPLAVEVAGGFLAVGVQTFEQYLQELAAPGLLAVEFGAELRESLPTGHDRSISRTLLKSIRQLSPGGLDFLRVASVLAVAPIPLALVGQILPEVVSAIDAVDSLSLCEKSGSDARTVHTLVSRTVRFVLADDGRLGELRNAVIRRLSERLQLVPDIRRHSDVASEIFHARHILGAGLLTAEQATLGAWVAEYDYARGDLPTARRLREEVVEVRSRLLGEEHPDTLNAKSSLAATLWAQGEFVAAQKLEEQVLRAMRPLLGDDHPDTLNAMHVLALIFWAQNRWAGGRELEEQVLEGRRRVLGEDHMDTLKAMGNLAHSRWAEGDLVGARELEEQVLEAMRRLLGDEHPHTLTAMNNLADTLRTQGDLVRARKLQEQVLEAMRRLLGEEHPHTLAVINNLAATLKAEGSLARAQKLLEHVLEGRRRVLGVDHPDTLVTLRALADTISCAEQLGRFEK